MALSLFHLSDSFCLGRAGEKLKGLTSVESLLYKVHWKKKNASGFTWNIWGRCVSCLEAANIPSTCLSLGAVAWHCRICVGMGLRSRSKCRCDAQGDHLQFSAGFRNFWAHSRDWICLADTGKLLSFEGAPSSFLLFVATLLGPWVLKLWNFVSEFKSRVASALANRGQRLVVQPELTCPLWKASAQKNVAT